MSSTTAFAIAMSRDGGDALPATGIGKVLSRAEAGEALGISEEGVSGLADAGLLGAAVGRALFAREAVEDFAERVWRAALPTASDTPGVRLRDAVGAAAAGRSAWPVAIAALFDGRLNAFRRRGVFGEHILSSLVVSSESVIADLLPMSEGADAAPFIWTPTTPRRVRAS